MSILLFKQKAIFSLIDHFKFVISSWYFKTEVSKIYPSKLNTLNNLQHLSLDQGVWKRWA